MERNRELGVKVFVPARKNRLDVGQPVSLDADAADIGFGIAGEYDVRFVRRNSDAGALQGEGERAARDGFAVDQNTVAVENDEFWNVHYRVLACTAYGRIENQRRLTPGMPSSTAKRWNTEAVASGSLRSDIATRSISAVSCERVMIE